MAEAEEEQGGRIVSDLEEVRAWLSTVAWLKDSQDFFDQFIPSTKCAPAIGVHDGCEHEKSH